MFFLYRALPSVDNGRLRDHFLFIGAIRFINLTGFLAIEGIDSLLCRVLAFFHREVQSARIWHRGIALTWLYGALRALLVFTECGRFLFCHL